MLNSCYLWTLQCCFPLSWKNLLCFPQSWGFISSPGFNCAKLGCKLQYEAKFRKQVSYLEGNGKGVWRCCGEFRILMQGCVFGDVEKLKQARGGFMDSASLGVFQKRVDVALEDIICGERGLMVGFDLGGLFPPQGLWDSMKSRPWCLSQGWQCCCGFLPTWAHFHDCQTSPASSSKIILN